MYFKKIYYFLLNRNAKQHDAESKNSFASLLKKRKVKKSPNRWSLYVLLFLFVQPMSTSMSIVSDASAASNGGK